MTVRRRIGIRAAAVIAAATFAAALIPPIAPGQEGKRAATDRLAAESEVIVVGTVGAMRSTWNADSTRIQTVVTIRVGETLKGAVPGGTLDVVIPGGEVGDVGEWYSHSVRFAESEEVVVFAAKDRNGVMRVTSGERGKFVVREGPRAGSKIIPNVGNLEVFTAGVREAVKASTPADREN